MVASCSAKVCWAEGAERAEGSVLSWSESRRTKMLSGPTKPTRFGERSAYELPAAIHSRHPWAVGALPDRFAAVVESVADKAHTPTNAQRPQPVRPASIDDRVPPSVTWRAGHNVTSVRSARCRASSKVARSCGDAGQRYANKSRAKTNHRLNNHAVPTGLGRVEPTSWRT